MDFTDSSQREWLETNGTGAFAMGTVAGINTRRYHALLVASLKPPTERYVLLSRFEEEIVNGDQTFALGCCQYPGLLVDDGSRFLEDFSGLIKEAAKAAKAEHPRVAFCGECLGRLWAEGKTDAAIRLEQGCDELVKTHDVDILCAYPLRSFHGEEDEHIFQSICAEHSAAYSR